MEVPGAALDVGEIDRGLTLTFTTLDPSQVDPMRSAVERLARSFRSGEHDHRHGRHAAHRIDEHWHYTGFPQAEITVLELPNGARIELRASLERDVAALRAEARAEAEMMRRGACPLLPAELAARPPPG